MGFYPLAGSANYVIGSPLFKSVKITRKQINGMTCTLQLNVENFSRD